MLVSNYMSSAPVTVHRDDNYDIAFEIMEKEHAPLAGSRCRKSGGWYRDPA